MARQLGYRPTKAVIQLEAIKNNVQSLRNELKDKVQIIAVVKADGYGHGMIEVSKAAIEAGAEMLAVATPDEAIFLRAHGLQDDILVMGPSPVSFAQRAAELSLSITVSDAEWLEQLMDVNEPLKNNLKIHVKIDSGMGRIGIRKVEELKKVLEMINEEEQYELEGVFTHFPCADDGCVATTKSHFERFLSFVELFPEKPKYVHASNSAATLLYSDYHLDAVRFGISLYGIAPSEVVKEQLPFPLTPSLSLETELAFVKRVEKGQSISYGATYATAADEWIATLPIGYADGLKRGLRGQEVLVNGQRVPIVGTICMDQCMIKLPERLPIGTKVTLIGKQGDEEITVEEWADRLNTIPYEIVVSISKRVPRVYSGSKQL